MIFREKHKKHLKPNNESITDESIWENCSIIEKISLKGVSFSDFICTFVMSCYDFICFWIHDTKISEKNNMTKLRAIFCYSECYEMSIGDCINNSTGTIKLH